MKKSDLIYLDHIFQSLSKAVEYLENVQYDDFLIDEEKQDALIRKIEVSGEATKRLSGELRQRFGQVPWRESGIYTLKKIGYSAFKYNL